MTIENNLKCVCVNVCVHEVPGGFAQPSPEASRGLVHAYTDNYAHFVFPTNIRGCFAKPLKASYTHTSTHTHILVFPTDVGRGVLQSPEEDVFAKPWSLLHEVPVASRSPLGYCANIRTDMASSVFPIDTNSYFAKSLGALESPREFVHIYVCISAHFPKDVGA